MSAARAAIANAFIQRVGAALVAAGLDAKGDADTIGERIARWARGSAPAAWLAFVAVFGRFPSGRELARLRRELLLADDLAFEAFIRVGIDLDRRFPGAIRPIEIVSDRVVVDVGHSATNDHNTGIQRVVRSALPHWAERDVDLVAWTDDSGGFRRLTDRERERVMRWRGAAAATEVDPQDRPTALVVPWQTTVVLPEVALAARCAPLASVAASSGSSVAMIGYDLIPLISADHVDAAESDRLAHYLEIVKHAALVVAISRSAASEFEGFRSTLVAQGLAGPAIVAVPLGEEAVDGGGAPALNAEAGTAPLILCVGSHESRKNQRAVLAAATALHRDGVPFRLVFVGGGARRATVPFDREIVRLVREGMQVESHRRLGDGGLGRLYAEARFTVMLSLHEGYGLPVVESLARGVPVLCSDYGALAEVAEGGGCLLVDPRDPVAVVRAMRRMLADDVLVERLRAEALARPERGWDRYADELWTTMTTEAAT